MMLPFLKSELPRYVHTQECLDKVISCISDEYTQLKIILSNLVPTSGKISTIAVSGSKSTESIQLIASKDFLDKFRDLSDKVAYSKILIFVLFHEASHVFNLHLSHNIVMGSNEDTPTITTRKNIAMDIAINEHLSNILGLDFLQDIAKYIGGCVVETCFTPDQIKSYSISKNGGHRYYYNLLTETNNTLLSIPHDDHGLTDIGDGSDVSKSILKRVVNDSSKLKKIESNGDSGDSNSNDDRYSIDGGGGYSGNKSVEVISSSINWNIVLQSIARTTTDNLSWYNTHNKYEYILGTMMLPTEYDNVPEKSIVIIMDTSGTCSKLIPSFSGLLKSCFDYQQSPTVKLNIDIIIFASSAIRYHNEKDIAKLVRAPVGFGTNIKAVKNILTDHDYDEYVCITDGYTDGTVLGEDDPSKWVWIFPKSHSERSCHKSSRKIVLTDL